MNVSQRRLVFHLNRWIGLLLTVIGVVVLFRGNAVVGVTMIVIGVVDFGVSVIGFRRERLR